MSFVSYAQNFEDVMLWRALHDVEDGRYLDVGAQDPNVDSVSLAFYLAGWRGIHVEPTPAYAARLRAARPDETVIEAAVSDLKGPIEFYEIPDTGLSTGNADIADSHRKIGYESRLIIVPCVRLDDLLDLAGDEIQWMKIDVEGLEADVLRSWGDNPRRPWVVVVEATFPNSQRPSSHLWEDELKRRDYREVHFDGLSRYYLHKDQKALADRFASPPNVFDQFMVTPAHFTAGQVVRDYENRLESTIAEATRRDGELLDIIERGRAETDAATAAAEAAAATAQVATAERDQALGHAGAVHARFEAAEEQHQASLELAAAERERLRGEATAIVERLVISQREHREAVEQLWREREVATTELHRSHQQDRNRLLAELEDARNSAALAHAKMVRDHATEVGRLKDELLATTQRLMAEHRDREVQLRGELQASETRLEDELRRADSRATVAEREVERRDGQITLLEERLLEAGQASLPAVERLQSEVEIVKAERDRAQAEAGKSRAVAEQAHAIAEQAGVDAERALAEFEQARAEVGQSRADAEQARVEIGQSHAQAENARAEVARQIALLRSAAEEAHALMQAAIAEPPQRWQRIGQALGLARPSPSLRALGFWSLPSAEASAILSTTVHQSEPAMHSPAPPDARDPVQRAESLADLLSWHDVEFVRCAYVTLLGRAPESAGEVYYTDRIRRGYSKLSLLAQLRKSVEGRGHDPEIAGLDHALKKASAFRITGFGWLAPDSVSNSPSDRLLRSLGNGSALLDHNNQLLAGAIEKFIDCGALLTEAQRQNEVIKTLSLSHAEQLMSAVSDIASSIARIDRLPNRLSDQLSHLEKAVTDVDHPDGRSTGESHQPITIEQLLKIVEDA